MKKIFIMLIAVLLSFMLYGCELLGIQAPETSKSTTQNNQTTVASQDTTVSTQPAASQTTTTQQTQTQPSATTSMTTTTTDEVSELVIYYTDIDGYLIPVTITVPRTYQVASESLDNMIKNSRTFSYAADYGLFPVLPEGTTVIEISIENGVATVDFNSAILNYADKTEEYNIFVSVIYVMTGFSTVDSVRIFIEGNYPGILKYDAVINRPLTRKDVMINSNKFLTGAGKNKYDVYFIRPVGNAEYLVPLSAEYNGVPVNEVPGKMIEVLLQDLTEYNLFSQIPEETKVISSSIDSNGTLEVILSQEITGYGGGSARELSLLNQLLYSFSEIEGAKRIKLTIDGAPDVLPEGTGLDEPFPVIKYINRLE